MQRYLLLFRNDQTNVSELSDADAEALFARFVTWTEELQARGRFQGVERLLEPLDGRTVRRRADQLTIDGPYAEGKEAVVGLYIVLADDFDDALATARTVPYLEYGGSVEVRELGHFPAPDAAPTVAPSVTPAS